MVAGRKSIENHYRLWSTGQNPMVTTTGSGSSHRPQHLVVLRKPTTITCIQRVPVGWIRVKKARFLKLLKTNRKRLLDRRATLKILTTRTQRWFRVKLDSLHGSAKSIAMRDTFSPFPAGRSAEYVSF